MCLLDYLLIQCHFSTTATREKAQKTVVRRWLLKVDLNMLGRSILVKQKMGYYNESDVLVS